VGAGVTLAETVGFSVPAAVGVAVTGTSLGRLAIAVVLAGSVEGGTSWHRPSRLSIPMGNIAGSASLGGSMIQLLRAPTEIAGNGKRSSSRSEHHAWSE
jgi:hypothetical protein